MFFSLFFFLVNLLFCISELDGLNALVVAPESPGPLAETWALEVL